MYDDKSLDKSFLAISRNYPGTVALRKSSSPLLSIRADLRSDSERRRQASPSHVVDTSCEADLIMHKVLGGSTGSVYRSSAKLPFPVLS